VQEKKHAHIRNIEMDVMKSPEQIAMMDDDEQEKFKEQIYTSIFYGPNSPQTTPLKKTFAMPDVRTPRDKDSPSTAQQKRLNRCTNVNGDSIQDLVVTGLATDAETIKIATPTPKFTLPLEKVFTFEEPKEIVHDKYFGTPRPKEKVKTSFELIDILANPLCREHLAIFLKKEYCEENMHFYENVIVFNTWKNKRQRLPHANEIFDKFIKIDAPQQVNIDMYAITAVEERIKSKQICPSYTNHCRM
jgi:uncharacterized protein YbaR (Trm112 family)